MDTLYWALAAVAAIAVYVAGVYVGWHRRSGQVERAKDEAHRWEFAAILAARISDSARQGWAADLARKEATIAKLWLENRELRERCGETADE